MTDVSLRDHLAALREADLRFLAERDRRYTEVADARAEALGIKSQADRDALVLARAGQDFRDEQANRLREQISSERGLYATKEDLIAAVREVTATITPLTAQADSARGAQLTVGRIYAAIATLGVILSIVVVLARAV